MRPRSSCPGTSPLQTLKHVARPFLKFLLIWHLWTMEHLPPGRSFCLQHCWVHKRPRLPPCSLSNNTISYLSIYLSLLIGQTIDLENLPTCWCVGHQQDQNRWPLFCSITKGVLLVPLHLRKVKFCARHPAVDVLDVIAGALKVSGGIVGAGDEDLQSSKRGQFFTSYGSKG